MRQESAKFRLLDDSSMSGWGFAVRLSQSFLTLVDHFYAS